MAERARPAARRCDRRSRRESWRLRPWTIVSLSKSWSSTAPAALVGRAGRSWLSALLILGGTAEAAALAEAACTRFAPALDVITSLAGRLPPPRGLAGDVRIGGFGGTDGLVRYLEEARIGLVIDATHPFAATISAHAAAACAATGIAAPASAAPALGAAAGGSLAHGRRFRRRGRGGRGDGKTRLPHHRPRRTLRVLQRARRPLPRPADAAAGGAAGAGPLRRGHRPAAVHARGRTGAS